MSEQWKLEPKQMLQKEVLSDAVKVITTMVPENVLNAGLEES